MRVNCKKVLEAFEKGKERRAERSIWTNGDSIYSYYTCLVTKVPGGLALNGTRYSATTTVHQNALRAALAGRVVAEVRDLRQGADQGDLRDAANEVLALAV